MPLYLKISQIIRSRLLPLPHKQKRPRAAKINIAAPAAAEIIRIAMIAAFLPIYRKNRFISSISCVIIWVLSSNPVVLVPHLATGFRFAPFYASGNSPNIFSYIGVAYLIKSSLASSSVMASPILLL